MIARVRLDLAVRKEFDYLIPAELGGQVGVGSRVKVPFGPRQALGCVIEVVEHSPQTNLRSVMQVIGRQALVTPKVLELARWISQYYACDLEVALRSVLPEAVRREKEGWRQLLVVHALPPVQPFPKLTSRQQVLWEMIEKEKKIPLTELLSQAKTTLTTVRRLEDLGLVKISPEISERDPYELEQILPTQALALNADQAKALESILKVLPQSKESGLTDLGAITSRGDSHSAPSKHGEDRHLIQDLPLGEMAKEATASRMEQFPEKTDTRETSSKPGVSSKVFLLHGVTGSGKTEVYLQAIEAALRQGLGAIVLVPEISLTPQTVERFKSRFCSGPLQTLVAVLHSHLSSGERHDEWHKIRQGRARVVVGARSAIFAPVDPLGLIIVDEEHDHSYKQGETPRYNARDVAVVRGRMEGAAVVLGSATPSLESYYNVKRGKYQLLELPQRADDKKMPRVRVVDLRSEMYKQKGPPIFSLPLREAITQRLEAKEQVILFLNRRGYSTALQCPKCGYVAGCPNCSISLTYHRLAKKLCCHICGHEAEAPTVCPQATCGSPDIRYSGLGTEKVEAALTALFPKASVRRMDSDALKRKEDYRKILGDFRTGKIDILVGTQMIAKGLHFPNVTLVGIIYADSGLNLPDFRAGERTFQLLTQVAGRAGRGDIEGEVVVQTFAPFHAAIQFARRHDFQGFYQAEMEFRAQLNYPPLSHIALLTLKGRNEEKVKFAIDHLKRELDEKLIGFKDLIVAGPAPAPLLKAETFYRYQIMLRTRQISRLSELLAGMRDQWVLPEDISLVLDIDPGDLI